jgi:hypothetical protein
MQSASTYITLWNRRVIDIELNGRLACKVQSLPKREQSRFLKYFPVEAFSARGTDIPCSHFSYLPSPMSLVSIIFSA